MVNTTGNQLSEREQTDLRLKESRKQLTDQQLYSELGEYYKKADSEGLRKADLLRTFMEEKNAPSAPEQGYKNFGTQYGEVNKKLKELDTTYNKQLTQAEKQFGDTPTEEQKKTIEQKKVEIEKERALKKNEELQKFFTEDMKNYIGGVGKDIKGLEDFKNAQIDDLKAQLTGIVTHGPKLKEYLSWSRRRLVTVQSKIQEMKENKAEYPKNVLIYLMGMTNSSLLGTRQKLKRAKVKALRKWKSDDIKDQLKIFEDKIALQSGDSQWTIGLKKLLSQELLEAKQAYVEKQKKNVGLAA